MEGNETAVGILSSMAVYEESQAVSWEAKAAHRIRNPANYRGCMFMAEQARKSVHALTLAVEALELLAWIESSESTIEHRGGAPASSSKWAVRTPGVPEMVTGNDLLGTLRAARKENR
jgi:hypothetical protein